MKNNKIAVLIGIVCSILLMTTLCLPYVSATNELDAWFDSHVELSDAIFDDALTIQEAKGMSVLVFSLKYDQLFTKLSYDADEAVVYGCWTFLLAVFVLSVLLIVFTALKKSIGMLVCDSIALVLFVVLNQFLKLSEIVSPGMYGFGIGFALYIICLVGIAVSAFWIRYNQTRAKNIA